METPIEWLERRINTVVYLEASQKSLINHYITRAKDMERVEIIEAHNNAVVSPYTDLYVFKVQGKSPITKGEDYYNRIYNKNNNI